MHTEYWYYPSEVHSSTKAKTLYTLLSNMTITTIL